MLEDLTGSEGVTPNCHANLRIKITLSFILAPVLASKLFWVYKHDALNARIKGAPWHVKLRYGHALCLKCHGFGPNPNLNH